MTQQFHQVYIQEKWKHLSTQQLVHECLCNIINHGEKVEATYMSIKCNIM